MTISNVENDSRCRLNRTPLTLRFIQRGLKVCAIATALLASGSFQAANAQGTVSIIHNFLDGSVVNDGHAPQANLVQGADGSYYGTTGSGGSVNRGTVFKLTPTATATGTTYTFTILHSFMDGSAVNDGESPTAGLILGSDGSFYGTTLNGGSQGQGTVFKMTSSGVVTILHQFYDGSVANDGAVPFGGLVQGIDGNFYGTTEDGGQAGFGTVYQITPSGAVTILHSFGDGSIPNDGWMALSALIQTTDGTLYGTTNNGGSAKGGTVFSITPSGSMTILHSFGDGSVANDGRGAQGGLIIGSDGNLYGTTQGGGADASQSGTVYQITPGGQVTILHSFHGSDGQYPFTSLLEGSDGNFYGTAFDGGLGGTLFSVTPSGAFTLLHSFGDGTVLNDGTNPYAGLIAGSDGNLYGTTIGGGTGVSPSAYESTGTVFQFAPTVPLAALKSVAVDYASRTGTVTLTATPAVNISVALASSNPAAASVPATVTIPAGSMSATFPLTALQASAVLNAATTVQASAIPNAIITATYNGSNQTASLAPQVSSVTLFPKSIRGGSFALGIVTLNQPAQQGGTVVDLTSSSAFADPYPDSITISAGATQGYFVMSSSHVKSTLAVTISASANGGTQTAVLTLTRK